VSLGYGVEKIRERAFHYVLYIYTHDGDVKTSRSSIPLSTRQSLIRSCSRVCVRSRSARRSSGSFGIAKAAFAHPIFPVIGRLVRRCEQCKPHEPTWERVDEGIQPYGGVVEKLTQLEWNSLGALAFDRHSSRSQPDAVIRGDSASHTNSEQSDLIPSVTLIFMPHHLHREPTSPQRSPMPATTHSL
jgi:hypothetical protein